VPLAIGFTFEKINVCEMAGSNALFARCANLSAPSAGLFSKTFHQN
jgi:hypothetical protein